MSYNQSFLGQNINDDEIPLSPYILNLRRELFYLWVFIAKEELLEDASEFISEYRDIPAPIENWVV